MQKKKKIKEQSPTYEEMRDILNQIYIARNITLNEKMMLKCLNQIDKWFRDKDNYN